MAFAWPLFLKGHTCSFSFSFLGWHFGECARMELRGESTASGDLPSPLSPSLFLPPPPASFPGQGHGACSWANRCDMDM